MDIENHFLLNLSPEPVAALKPHLERVRLTARTVIQTAGSSAKWVYFPETMAISFLEIGVDGAVVETSGVGSEGAAGLLEACGSQVYRMDSMVQTEGAALRAPARVCKQLLETNREFLTAAFKMAELLLAESRRSVYCHATHGGQERFARLLAETADRAAGRSTIRLTHEVISTMLGVRRPSATLFAQNLKNAGVIGYSHGKVEILDRSKLEFEACECLDYMRRQRQELGFHTRESDVSVSMGR